MLVAMRGLPASGKTAAALAWVSEDKANRVRVGRDPLRDALWGARKGLSREQEEYLTFVEHELIRQALRGGKHVVVDDLNLRLRYARSLAGIAQEEGARFEVLDMPASVEECVKRDRGRENSVGEDQIRDLNRRFAGRPKVTPPNPKGGKLRPAKYEPNPDKPMAWIFDVDGTLALNLSGRSWYDLSRVGEDSPNPSVVQLAQDLSELGYEILVCSGREDSSEEVTAEWLSQHLGHDRWHELFMRKAGDHRPDDVVKLELFDTYIRDNWNVIGVVDDRKSVTAMWRELGLTCLQADWGDF